MPRLSVVIPVFGVEPYIERCARRLFEQTLTDIEYIFVDDCTPDRSIEILERLIDEYADHLAKEHKTVRIIRMDKNQGLAAVRKKGILACTGDFIICCDSDDWLDTTMYETLYNHAISTHSDVVICDYMISSGNKDSERVFAKNIKDTSREALLKRTLTSSDLNPLWSMMARRELHEGLLFPPGNLGEDKTIVMQILWKARKVTYVPRPLYYYFLSASSILRSVNKEANIRKFNDVIKNRKVLFEFFDRENIKISVWLLDAFKFLGKTGLLEPFLDDARCRQLWKETFPVPLARIIFNPYIGVKPKVRYILHLLKVWKYEL